MYVLDSFVEIVNMSRCQFWCDL